MDAGEGHHCLLLLLLSSTRDVGWSFNMTCMPNVFVHVKVGVQVRFLVFYELADDFFHSGEMESKSVMLAWSRFAAYERN